MRRSRAAETPWKAVLLALGLLLALAQAALADELDDRVRQIAKQLQCPVCESVSVADSPSELATQMRAVIRARLEAGDSEEQIVRYFVERYGDGVLVEPPRRGLGLAVWWAPVLALLAGGAALVALLGAWVRHVDAPARGENSTGSEAAPMPERSYQERARRELERFRREVEG